MPRTIQVSVPFEETDELIGRLKGLPGIVGLSLARRGSLDPPGDVLTVQATNEGTRVLFGLLGRLELAKRGSFASSDLQSLVSDRHHLLLENESNEITREEMAFLLKKETNLKAAVRWLVDVAIVLAASVALFAAKQAVVRSTRSPE